jgi:hypothetical protein
MASLLKNSDIMGEIIRFTGDCVVLEELREYLDPADYIDIVLHKRRILIYGQVQSGKTVAIMEAIQKPVYDKLQKIIVIQNSLLVLKQYQQRLKDAGITYQVIKKNTRNLASDVLILMNNKARYAKYCKLVASETATPPKYVLFMDECDSYYKGTHPLAQNAVHEYYITATPRNKQYMTPGFFHTVERIPASSEYKGMHHIDIEYSDSSVISVVEKFTREIPNGMLLINAYRYIAEMECVGRMLSYHYEEIPIVLLNSERKIFYRGRTMVLKYMSIAAIIDRLKSLPHVVFISNRMSLRGLSYCSSDYTRHLTHQYSNFSDGITITNSLQRMRLLGKYVDDTPLKLIVPTDNESKIMSMFDALDMEFTTCRTFTL